VQEWIGNPYPTGWLQVPAFLLLLVPMNLLTGGAIIAAVMATMKGNVESRRLVAWLTRTFPAAMIWSAIAGALALHVLGSLAMPQGRFQSVPRPTLGHEAADGTWPILTIISGLVIAGSLHRFTLTRGGASRAKVGMWAFTLSLSTVSALCVAGLNVDEQDFLGARPEFGPSLAPRFFHTLLAAVAVAGMLVALHGLLQRRRDERYSRWVVERGMRWFVVPTALQMVVGFYLLLALPGAVRSRFLGGSPVATAEIIAGILLAIAAFSVVTHATNAADPRRPLIAGAVLLAGTLIVMALLREQVRYAYLEKAYARLPECRPSAGEVAIPLALMGATGIGMAAWLLRRLDAAPPT